ncbi:sulfatase [Parvibaculum sp.]|uniref:sulfatase family protein n=1 Tax=Parvibaculum sp. TaxID=2024848 RepID=UPI003BAAAF7F
MKKWQIYSLAAAVIVAGLAGTAYAFRKDIVLYAVATRARDATNVAPNREIIWEKGPEAASVPADKRPPNIVVILADDLGFNDISYFGGGLIETPNIDALAKTGANFSHAYAGTAACAPSRAMIMTGRYGTRTGFEFTPTPPGMTTIVDLFYNDGTRPHEMIFDKQAAENAPPFREQGLPGSEITLAEALKPQGYHTMHIGKWHLGNSPGVHSQCPGLR